MTVKNTPASLSVNFCFILASHVRLKGWDVESKEWKRGYVNRESGCWKSQRGSGSGHQIKEFTPCHLGSMSKETESPDDRGANFHLNIYLCLADTLCFFPGEIWRVRSPLHVFTWPLFTQDLSHIFPSSTWIQSPEAGRAVSPVKK